MSCDLAATWIVQTPMGHMPMCDECIQYRHCGDDFSLIIPCGFLSCVCGHTVAKMEQDRARRGRCGCGRPLAAAEVSGGVCSHCLTEHYANKAADYAHERDG